VEEGGTNRKKAIGFFSKVEGWDGVGVIVHKKRQSAVALQ
jgi:hypothetical protein